MRSRWHSNKYRFSFCSNVWSNCKLRLQLKAIRHITGLKFALLLRFLPHCMECQRGLATTKVSVCLSNTWIVRKRKKDLSRFSYHTKGHIAWFSEKKNGWWRRPLLPQILGQADPVGAKSSIFSRYSLVAPQR